MRACFLTLLAAAAATLAACGPPAPGTSVPIARLCDQPDDSRVRLDGYIRYRRGLLSFCRSTDGKTTDCDLALYADAAPPADFNVMSPPRTAPEPLHARLTLKIGNSPGQMDDLPERFSASDVKLHVEGGKTVGEGARVHIDGEVHIIPAAPEANLPKSCYVTVDWAKAAG